MPITIYTRPEYNLTIITHTGEVPDNEFNEFYWRFFQGEVFKKPMKLLIDLREADSRQRSPGTLHEFAGLAHECLNELSTFPRVAVVAPKSLSYGLARMYQSYADSVPWEFIVFRAIDAALAWLEVPEDLDISEGEET